MAALTAAEGRLESRLRNEFQRRLGMRTLVEENSMESEISSGLARAGKSSGEVTCRVCGGDRVTRVFREGFLQRHVYPLFGFYPWQCKTCSSFLMLRKRRKLKRTSSPV